MTHDELLNDIGLCLENNYTKFLASALRAVVKLHKPVIYINLRGAECRDCDTPYPCPTIQAIEKELK